MSFYRLLEHNVLDVIVEYISQCDASNLALTCHTLFDVAMSRFLSEANFLAASSPNKRIRQFCTFILAKPDKIRHLRIFRVGDGLLDSDCPGEPLHPADSTASLVAQVLEQATGLRCLEFTSREVSQALRQESRLVDALASLPNISHLCWRCTDNYVLRCISRMSCSPCRLLLSQHKRVKVRQSVAERAHLPRDDTFLANVASSIQHLEIRDEDGLLGRIACRVVWPNVRCAVLWCPIELARLPYAFPAAQEIHLHFANINQEWTRTRTHNDLPSWSKLDYLNTSSPLPSPCPIRRIQLESQIIVSSTLPQHIAFIHQAGPAVLTALFNLYGHRQLQELVPALSSVRVLGVDVYVQDRPVDARPIDIILRNFVSPLSGLGLDALYFKVKSQYSATASEVEELARIVAQKIPSLTYVGIPCNELYRLQATRRDSSWFFRETIGWFKVLSREVHGSDHTVELRSYSLNEGDKLQSDLLDQTGRLV